MTLRLRSLGGLLLALLAGLALSCKDKDSSSRQAQWEIDADEAIQAFAQKNLDLAERRFRSAIEGALESGSDDPKIARMMIYHGDLQFEQQRYDDARAKYSQALQWLEKAGLTGDRDYAMALNNLANTHYRLGHYEEAEPLFRQAIELRERIDGPESIQVATMLNNLATLCKSMGRYPEAESLYLRSLAIKEKTLQPTDMSFARAYSNMGQLYHLQANYPKAEEYFRKALKIWLANLPPDHQYVDLARQALVIALKDLGRDAEAAELETSTDLISLLGIAFPTTGTLPLAQPPAAGTSVTLPGGVTIESSVPGVSIIPGTPAPAK